MAKTKLEDWLAYLESRVNVDLYVWGANGEDLVSLLPKLCVKEKDGHSYESALDNVNRTLTLLQKRLKKGIDIYDICCEDCSGLGVKYLLLHKIISYDMTANSLYDYIVGTEKTKAHGKAVSLSNVKAGDFLFKGSDKKKVHIGYAINHEYAIESQDHDKGVVCTKISERPWGYAARPDWYEDIEPEPVKPILKRELYYTNPLMYGDDVKDVQGRLNELDYNCGIVDGYFGKKTSASTVDFQKDKGLIADGIIGKKTAEALGFTWAGV